MDQSCKSCNSYAKPTSNSGYSWISGILLAVIPKCPFCLLAYSSTMMLCGEGSIINSSATHISPITIVLTSLLGILTLIGIFLNKRGKRTLYALMMALFGMSLLISSVLLGGGELLYYIGTSIVFIAIWFNGSMFWFVNKLMKNKRERKALI